jgi:hypothetical protein
MGSYLIRPSLQYSKDQLKGEGLRLDAMRNIWDKIGIFYLKILYFVDGNFVF